MQTDWDKQAEVQIRQTRLKLEKKRWKLQGARYHETQKREPTPNSHGWPVKGTTNIKTTSLSTKVRLIIGLLIYESALSVTPLSQADAEWLMWYLNNWLQICIDENNIVKSGLFLWPNISFSVLMGFVYPARALWKLLSTADVLLQLSEVMLLLSASRPQSATVVVLFKSLYVIYFWRLNRGSTSEQYAKHIASVMHIGQKVDQMSRQTSATAPDSQAHILSLSSENNAFPNLGILNILDKLKD